eukprot:scaffold12228_cov57-Phaeocystis_antarctica.AAC.4
MKDNHFLKNGDTSCTTSKLYSHLPAYLLTLGGAARQAPNPNPIPNPHPNPNPNPNQAGLHAKHVLSKKQGQKATAGRGLDEDEERDEIVLKQRRK